MLGRIFRIQRFSIHDGYGIRTTVFLKGCPLRCIWCHNPESQNFERDIAYKEEKCLFCLNCVAVCERKAIRVNYEAKKIEINRNICDSCGRCSGVCNGNAIEIFGFDVEAVEVIDIVERDRIFYKHSGGGVTFSGGEPYSQPEFLLCLLSLCKERGINTAVDTSGYASWKTIEKSIDFVDLFLYDIKDYLSERHKVITGVRNELILTNLKKLVDSAVDVVVRVPFIPGCNFKSKDDFIGFIKMLSQVGVEKVDLLPYHSLARDKYRWLGREFHDFSSSSGSNLNTLDEFAEVLRNVGFKVTERGYF
jgi:pyruvate formate lyase activating enzyme